ncbi:MAG TPA: ABC transporter ATP-binding protein [Candidatus Limnocylindria bacterium]|nr:ABC transporter ATP-binding protein [Candidatus Limnocylindria bacterium]
MTTLQVQTAFKTYGKVEALRGAALELGAGEMLALLGPNGAGKTTLVRAIAGRVRLDRGTIELLGEALSPASPRPALGVVPQEVALYPLLTARENLEAFGRLNAVSGSRLRERVKWALEWTQLAERSREPIKRFSGGMRRRLNIACGILHEPQVVLLDEPTVGVDPQSRERIYDMLSGLRAAGTSLLLTTHQLEEAEARCERIVILDRGLVIASGTLGELVRKTIGDSRDVTLRVDRPPRTPLVGFEADGADTTLRARVADVASDLPALLVRAQAAGCTIEDVSVRSPSLQSVFIHLTGRELRE